MSLTDSRYQFRQAAEAESRAIELLQDEVKRYRSRFEMAWQALDRSNAARTRFQTFVRNRAMQANGDPDAFVRVTLRELAEVAGIGVEEL